jgi:uncharacterized protein (DUF1501 family)
MSAVSSPTRRGFLASSAAATMALASPMPLRAGTAQRAIVLWLSGGPSQLDTFDPKPDAPSRFRGPFAAIATSVPGLHLSETLPRLAKLAHCFALVRSVYHDAPPVHEAGQQLLQTGRLADDSGEAPHVGAQWSAATGQRWAILPERLGSHGISTGHGQSAGRLGAAYEAWVPERLEWGYEDSRRYGATPFGRACLAARRLIEREVTFVCVNMYSTVFNAITWDCHADGGSLATNLADYRRTVCPTFDIACAALLEDLHQSGLLDSTLVVAMGEFGRTPHLNQRGGRDHWAGVWSVLLAGGGIRGGQVYGASDAQGGEPKDQPVHAAQIADTLRFALGLPAQRPLRELF